ncbi:MAG TPA: molybdate ABC transporter substrate-binding protein [Burkholderiaceae bacterium]|jgi:molybdate transport system substrate-binding protein|nr:molybdate ABC transporter substrate-binding protein [Burkholderiaceae bacterium]
MLGAAVFATAEARADDLTVSAAASLTNAFTDIAKAYETQHPGTHVNLNFGASDVLLKQIEQGAPADVFASADETTMDRAASAGRIDAASRRDFAANTLVLVTPAGSTAPAKLGDLAQDAYKHIAIGNPDSVPAGRYAKQALAEAKLWDVLQPKFVQAQNVRQALDYVARGEAEAGFVYATDAASQAAKVKVALTVPTATPVHYPAAAVGPCKQKPAACEFVQFLATPASRATLAKYGFSPVNP